MSIALAMAIGYLMGAVTVGVVGLLAFRVAARYQRTGMADPLPQIEERDPAPSNPEEAVHRRVTEDSVKRGTEAILMAAEQAGIPMTREQAQKDAREFLRSMPSGGPTGGVA